MSTLTEDVRTFVAERAAEDAADYLKLIEYVAADGEISPQAVAEELEGFGQTIEEFDRDVADVKRLAELKATADTQSQLENEHTAANKAWQARWSTMHADIEAIETKVRKLGGVKDNLRKAWLESRNAESEHSKLANELHQRIGLPVKLALLFPD